MIKKKYEIIKEPYIRKTSNKYYGTKNIMIDFIIALLPIILVGIYKNGIEVYIKNDNFYSLIHPLIFIILGGLFTFSIECVYYLLFDKSSVEISCIKKSLNSYSIIPGLLLSIILPLHTPIWILFIACLFATIIGKLIYGGFGNNIFNPALVGYIFVMTAFYGVIDGNKSDIFSAPTPLSSLNNLLFHNITIEELIENSGGLLNICFGLKSGTIAETSTFALLFSLIFLYVKRVIDIKTPIIIIVTFFFTAFIVALFLKINPFYFSLFNLFNGGILFGAIFMATEPVTSPRSYYGKIIYAFLIGLISLFLRLLSDLRDGTSTTILFMNMLSLIIDNFGAKLRVEELFINKLKKISIIVLIYLFLTSYMIIKINSYKVPNEKPNEDINIELININQNYEKLKENIIEFNYKIKINNEQFIISTDIDGNINSNINDLSEEYKEYIIEIIQKNKINKRSNSKKNHYGFIVSTTLNEDGEEIITSQARGYVNNVIIIAKYFNNKVEIIEVDLSKETELNGGLINSTGTKNDLINIGKGENSDIVSNVTYTSVSLFSARKAIYDYISYQYGGTNE